MGTGGSRADDSFGQCDERQKGVPIVTTTRPASQADPPGTRGAAAGRGPVRASEAAGVHTFGERAPHTISPEEAIAFAARFSSVGTAIGRVLVGKQDAVRLSLVCLISEGHLLLEDVPGTGKTTLAKALAATIARHHFADPVHPRPAAVRRHRRHHLRPVASARSSSTPGRSSRPSCWPTRSTAPHPRRSRRCWR